MPPVIEVDGEYILPLADGDWSQPGTGERDIEIKERRDLRKQEREGKAKAKRT